MVPGNDVAITTRQETEHRARWRKPTRCSVCTCAIWLAPIAVKEPPGAPEPRRSWTLCRNCHQALLIEMRRSPVRSPLRLRIALGLVASERAPRAYNYGLRSHIRDRRRFIGIAWVLIIAMLLHLAVIVILATIAK